MTDAATGPGMLAGTRPAFAPPVHPRDSTPDQPCQVGDLGTVMRDYIAKLGAPWVEGEITEWNRRASGVFATLRDVAGDAHIGLVVWSSVLLRIPKDIKVGDRVVVCVKPEYRIKTGGLSFVVSGMRHVGLGDMLERLEKLRATLRSEGLFDPARKRPLPFLPRRVGLITGENSDAEKDVLRNAQLRWPQVDFRVEHAKVQGDQSVSSVLAALKRLDADPTVEVIVIARGGGDLQDLLGFSDERLLRAVAAASTPVVSAIGHENDRPLLDDVADLRASTPTDAAKRVVPDVAEQLSLVRQLRSRLTTRLVHRVQHDVTHLEQLRSRPSLRSPDGMLVGRSQDVWLQLSRGRDLVERQVESALRRTGELGAALRALSPAATLARGYAIAHTDGGVIVRDAAQAPAGTPLVVTLDRGSLAARSEGEIAETARDGPQGDRPAQAGPPDPDGAPI